MEPLLAFKKIFFSSTAIYVSEDFIDVAEGSTVFGGMKISLLKRFPIEKNTKGLSYVDTNVEIGKLIVKLFPKEEDRPYRIAINVPNARLILRRFSIKGVSKNEIDQSIVFEAQKYIPSLIDNLTYGFKSYVLRPGLREIVFAAVETKNIRETIDFFSENNIHASTIEPVPALLARSLSLKKNLSKKGAYVFIHYEPHNRVILCEISHRYPYFFKELVIPQVEAGKNENGLSYPTLKAVWPHIEKDVIGGIDYLRKEAKERVDEILISGFEPSADELDLSREFGVPFARPDMSFFKNTDEKIKDRHLPVLMLLHDLQNKPFLNMAPEDVVKNDLWILKKVAMRSLIIFLVIIVAHLFLLGINNAKAGRVANAQKGLAAYEGISGTISREDILRYKDTLTGKAALINTLIDKKYYLTEKLTQLNAALPEECWVDNISYVNKTSAEPAAPVLTVRGFVFAATPSSNTDPNKILEAIKQNKKIMSGFKSIELVSVTKKEYLKNEITEFEIVLK
ncbi:MAG: hypothetical protein PHV48_00710 [Candidatus Omnitrophica bacterium]|nr:hypothetical protein [Candidatus Omnitrophota bacterium]